jgi:hypothetical protein
MLWVQVSDQPRCEAGCPHLERLAESVVRAVGARERRLADGLGDVPPVRDVSLIDGQQERGSATGEPRARVLWLRPASGP